MLDALDEAIQPEKAIRELVRPLAGPGGGLGVHLLVGTRPHLVRLLEGAAVILDLDATGYWEPGDMVEYVRRSLLLEQDPARRRPTATGRSSPPRWRARGRWSWPQLPRRQLVSRTLAQGDKAVDIGEPGWIGSPRASAKPWTATSAASPSSRRRPMPASASAWKRRLRDLLVPARLRPGRRARRRGAVGKVGHGDRDGRLSRAGRALAAADPGRGSAAGDPAGWQHGLSAFHQALVDHLRSHRDERDDQRRYLTTMVELVRVDGGGDWLAAPLYLRQHLAAHAAEAGRLDELLEDIDACSPPTPEGC